MPGNFADLLVRAVALPINLIIFFTKRAVCFRPQFYSSYMIIINVKEGESIDRALKRYKRKHRNVGVIKELRKRKQFTKPSVERRHEVLKARYKLEKQRDLG